MRHFLACLFALVITCILLPHSAPAQFLPTNGPAGGQVTSIVADGPIVYAGTSQNGGGVYESTDHGDTWHSVSASALSGDVIQLALKKTTLFCLMQGQFLAMDRASHQWSSISPSTAPSQDGHASSILAVDSELICTTNYGMLRSTDNGASFSLYCSFVTMAHPNTLTKVGGKLIVGSYSIDPYSDTSVVNVVRA